jgi:hypothetical protein
MSRHLPSQQGETEQDLFAAGRMLARMLAAEPRKVRVLAAEPREAQVLHQQAVNNLAAQLVLLGALGRLAVAQGQGYEAAQGQTCLLALERLMVRRSYHKTLHQESPMSHTGGILLALRLLLVQQAFAAVLALLLEQGLQV